MTKQEAKETMPAIKTNWFPPIPINDGAMVPQDANQLWCLALVAAKLGIKDKDTPEKCFMAMLWGGTVGLGHLSSLRNISVINGTPSIWGDAALALVRNSPGFQDIKETIEKDPNTMQPVRAVCVLKRDVGNRIDEVEREFTVLDAKTAGLYPGKEASAWRRYPKRMLQMRARGLAMRDLFPDVLQGLNVVSGIDDVERVDFQDAETVDAEPDPIDAMEMPPPEQEGYRERHRAQSGASARPPRDKTGDARDNSQNATETDKKTDEKQNWWAVDDGAKWKYIKFNSGKGLEKLRAKIFKHEYALRNAPKEVKNAVVSKWVRFCQQANIEDEFPLSASKSGTTKKTEKKEESKQNGPDNSAQYYDVENVKETGLSGSEEFRAMVEMIHTYGEQGKTAFDAICKRGGGKPQTRLECDAIAGQIETEVDAMREPNVDDQTEAMPKG